MACWCPHCAGEGELQQFAIGRGGRCELVLRPCALCEGRGRVDAAALERVRAGRRLRADRVRRGVTLWEEARRRGLGAGELSAIERGLPAMRRARSTTDE